MSGNDDGDKMFAVRTARGEDGIQIVCIGPASYEDAAKLTAEDWEQVLRTATAQDPDGAHVLFEHNQGAGDPMLARRAPTNEHNYMRLVEPLKPTFLNGTVTRIVCIHELWCDALNRRGNCNCNPVATAVRQYKVVQ
jgi:hypothetical protein